MNIIVVGCGKIGRTIIACLVEEGHDVIAVDSDRKILTEVTNVYDVMGVCGNGADCETLESADVDKAELLIATTASDELNMLSCFMAKRMGAKHTIARIRNPEYNDRSLGFMRQQLDISMAINPEMLAAQDLFNILKLPAAVKVETFSRRTFEMIEVRLKNDTVLDGMKLWEMRQKFREKFLVCVVQRGENVFIPDGNFVLRGGDRIGLTASRAELQKLLKNLDLLQKQAKNIMILGGSRTAFYLAKMLTASGSNVKIIEQDEQICKELCLAIPKAVVIRGDGGHQELLLEEGLASLDAFVSLTGIDEENILMSIFAMSHNVPKVIAKVSRDEMEPMAEKLGLDCVVSPRDIVSDVVVRYARALENSMGSRVETLYHLMDGKAEAQEFKVVSNSGITNIPLKELNIKKNILIAGIIRERIPIIPTGDDRILTGDRVIVVSERNRLQDLSDIV